MPSLFAPAILNIVDIDTRSHPGAFVVTAEKSAYPLKPVSVDGLLESVLQVAEFWSTAAERTREFEYTLAAEEVLAIYGAGFYGNFLFTALQSPERVRCFIDQNPHLQGHSIQGKPIVRASEMNTDVTTLLVGLNPASAKGIVDGMPSLASLRKFFL